MSKKLIDEPNLCDLILIYRNIIIKLWLLLNQILINDPYLDCSFSYIFDIEIHFIFLSLKYRFDKPITENTKYLV